jgi:hypothetical protein
LREVVNECVDKTVDRVHFGNNGNGESCPTRCIGSHRANTCDGRRHTVRAEGGHPLVDG